MAREKEMQEFTRSLFRGRPDLSTLTHSIVRRRFLAHAGRDRLEPAEKQALKRLVEEELLKMQGDEASPREDKLDLAKVKRPHSPCSDPERKKFRFNSESEPSSAASSPECFGPPGKNKMAAKELNAAKENPRTASKKTVESSDEEQQEGLKTNVRLGKEVKESSEEEDGPVRKSKVWKEENSEEEENEDEEKEPKGRTRKKPVTNYKQASGNSSVRRKQAREESEDSEKEPVQRMGKKAERKGKAKSHQLSEKESEEETLAEKREDSEEEDWNSRAQSHGGKKPAWEKSCKQKSKAASLVGDLGDRAEQKEKTAADNGDNNRGDEEPSVQRKREVRTQWKDGEKQSGSSEEDEEDSCRKVETTTKSTGKTAQVGRLNGEESDSEREVSDSESEGRPKGERKSRSSKKSSKKDRARSSSSSSSDGSPEPKGGKAGSDRRGEDHPAVMRLKRYIRACGAHRNYKKLLGSCRSHKERLNVLRAELEALGMKGNPSLEKCRALKEKREEAAEVASLDVANIINCSGRPRRRTAWNPSGEAAPPGELYRRTLDSEDERSRPPPPDWSHMRGIISSDGESN